jgi:outer membrane murein-binding lipoprotein Lpp
MTFQGIVAKFDFVPLRKISQILLVFKYNSSVSTQSHDILANYVASSAQWHKCYGTLRPRGNTKKPKTPDEMVSRMQLKDSDYSDDGSDIIVSNRSLRCHRPKPEKHQMTSRQDYSSAKRLKNDLFDYVDFTVDYKSPSEDFSEKTHEKQYSSPQAMKSDSQSKVKLKHQDIINAPKKEATPEWVINLMSSVKQLEQKVDNTMDEVDALKKKETAKQELQTIIKSEKSEDENNVDLTENYGV